MKTAERKTAVESMVVPQTNPSAATEEGTFTRYVRAIAYHSDLVGEMFEELRTELRKALVREMRWRSLWSGSPAYVGILGWTSWTPGNTGGTASPLDDVLSDCYLFIFGKQLRYLLNQLRVRSKIDGLVIVLLRHFLTERQKYHDPLGYRLFEILCTAVRGSVAAKEIHVLLGTEAIRNETILGATPDADPAQKSPVEPLRPLVAPWISALLPDLVIAEGTARRQVIASLRDYLTGLESAGVTVFRFKDLLDAFKDDVRARWSCLHRQEDGEIMVERDGEGRPRLVRILRPPARVEDLDSFKKLVRCVSNLIPKVDARKRTRVYLERLWAFLRRWSLDFRDDLPSNRELEKELKIPRDRFPGLYNSLAQLTRRCQGELSGTVVEIGGHQSAGLPAGEADE